MSSLLTNTLLDSADHFKKTIFYRYLATTKTSPYSGATSYVPATSGESAILSYRTFILGFSVSSEPSGVVTLDAPYLCPFPYDDAGQGLGAVGNILKPLYDKALVINRQYGRYTTAISTTGSYKKFDDTTSINLTSDGIVLVALNEFIDKIKDLLTNVFKFLLPTIITSYTGVTTASFSLTSNDIVKYDNFVKISDGPPLRLSPTYESIGAWGIIYNSSDLSGKYYSTATLHANDKPNDSDIAGDPDNSSPTQAITKINNLNTTLIYVSKVLKNIRNHSNFINYNNAQQPKNDSSDKTVLEVFEESINALDNAYKVLNNVKDSKVDVSKTTAINNNRISIEGNMREMYQLPGSATDIYKQQYSGTMMAGAMWTVLATTLIYYVFTEL
jgi:hypothetical protein